MAKITFEIADKHLDTLFGLFESTRRNLKPEVETAAKAEALGLILEKYATDNPLIFRDMLQNSLQLFQNDMFEKREHRVKAENIRLQKLDC